MKKQLLLLALSILTSGIFAQNFQWAKHFGGANFEISTAITLDGSGNVYTTGYFQGTCDFDPGVGTYTISPSGPADGFVSKLDASGNLIWAKNIGGPTANTNINSIAVDGAGNTYLTGVFNYTVDFDPGIGTYTLATSSLSNNMFVLKLDASGNFVWAKNIFTTGGLSIALDASSNVLVSGMFNGSPDFDPGVGTFSLTSNGNYDAYILKLTSAGNFVWAKNIGGTSIDQALDLSVDASSNVYSAGIFQGTSDFDPSASTYTLSAIGSQDAYIAKLDASGNFVWAKNIGGTSSSTKGNSIAVDASGNVYTTGMYTSPVDFDPSASSYTLASLGINDAYVSKLDVSGNFVWAKNMGMANAITNGISIVLDGANNIYTTGTYSLTVDFDPSAANYSLTSVGNYDSYVSKLDNSGNFVWAKSYGGTNSDQASSIAVDASGNSFTAGQFFFTADFDPSPASYSLTSAGATDASILKLGPCPSPAGNITGPASVCVGTASSSYSLSSVSGATGYIWSLPSGAIINSGTNTNSINITLGALSGSIIVTPTNSCGSSTSSTLSITINSLPTLTATSTNSVICLGKSTSLTASGATTYTWTNGVVNGASFSPSTTLTYTVNGTATATGCKNSTTYQITVNTLPVVSANATSSAICIGNTVTLNGGGANTYTWANGVSNGIAFSPTTSLTYTVTGTLAATGCSNTATKLITVNNLPIVSATASNSTICMGNTVTLNGSGANTYTWTNGVTNGIAFSPTTSLTYTVTGTATATGCKNIATKLITVNNLPSVLANTTNSVICIGNSVTLTGSGANTYTWTNSVTDGVAITPTNSATYIVTGTDLNNCLNSSSITITVNQLPVLNTTATNSIVCSGQQVTLGANGASTYTWIPGNQSGFLVNVTPTVTTIYTVTGTGSNGCTNIMTQSISVNTLPTITANTTNTLLCIGQTATLSATGANSYTWSTSENGVSIVVNPTSNTIYTISGTDNNGCNGTTTFTQNVSLCTGLDAISINSNLLINIYPNPNNGDFIIKTESDMTITIINNIGQSIQQLQLNSSNNFQLSIEGLSSGIYFIVGKNGQKSCNQKIIVSK